ANLLTNAIKYTPTGGKVTIGVRKEGPGVRVVVADTGLGIPANQQDKVFGRFFRGSNVRTLPGTGLGLHVLKAMLERAGCTLEFISQENVGSTFTVTIPTAGMAR